MNTIQKAPFGELTKECRLMGIHVPLDGMDPYSSQLARCGENWDMLAETAQETSISLARSEGDYRNPLVTPTGGALDRSLWMKKEDGEYVIEGEGGIDFRPSHAMFTFWVKESP